MGCFVSLHKISENGEGDRAPMERALALIQESLVVNYKMLEASGVCSVR